MIHHQSNCSIRLSAKYELTLSVGTILVMRLNENAAWINEQLSDILNVNETPFRNTLAVSMGIEHDNTLANLYDINTRKKKREREFEERNLNANNCQNDSNVNFRLR